MSDFAMPTDLPTDGLQRLFAMQSALNDYVFAKNEQGIRFADVARDRALQQTWVQNYTLAIRQECAELMDSTNWKWWRTKVDLFDEQNIVVELIDILHFWISACQVMGLTAEDALRIYEQKHEVNVQRQDGGYVKKDEDDSRHIG